MSDQNKRRFTSLLQRLIALIGVIVPGRFRTRFRQEWQAELEYREELLARWDRLDWRSRLELLWRSLGAFWDALWLQQLRWEDEMIQDLRFGVRMLMKQPGFTLIAVLTLALGIGANTAIFSVVNGVLLKSLPFPKSDQLLALSETSKEVPVMSVAYPNYLDWRAQQTVFEDLAARYIAGGVLTGAGEPERVFGRWVTASFFSTLGVKPQIGRFFNEEEDRPGAEALIVLGNGLWQRRYGGDPNLIGKTIFYNSESWTVVGVMPADFDFYGRDNLNNDFFIPLGRLADQDYMRDRHSHMFWVTGRMKTGVTIEQARAQMKSIAAQLEMRYPASNTGNSVELASFLDDYVGRWRNALLVISGAVALVLLIACANVANLLLARAAVRRRELAVRLALGAGRFRIVRQLLTESVMLALAGGALGLLLAVAGVELLIKLSPDSLPRMEEITIDTDVLGFTVLVALLTGITFGLAPALQTSKVDLNESLKETGRQSSGGAGAHRLRGALVVAEVALPLVLLAGAGLLLKSFQQLMEVDPGFDARNVLTLRLRLPDAKYRDAAQTTGFLKEASRRIAGLPGVREVSVATGFPLGRGGDTGYLIEGQPEPRKPGDWPIALKQSVSESFHRTLGITLLTGRYFTEGDTAEAPPVALVDDHFVRRHFPNGSINDALGKRLRFGGDGEVWRQIVGVVRHVRHNDLDVEGFPQIYSPWLQINPRWLADFTRVMDVIVKTSDAPMSLVAPIKREVQEMDKDQPLGNVQPLEALMAQRIAPRRFNLLLLGLFAFIALLLGAIGLYGVMSYAVTQRTRELGIRLALGAQKNDVLRLVIKQGMILSLTGVAIGLAAALALTKLMQSLLYEVSPTDPLTFAGITLLLSLVSFVACWIPASRAAKLDPMVALRGE
jgi:putative ABC transport system permease protein